MILKISNNTLKGKVTIPPSKSLMHRAIIAASLASGKSFIDNIIYSNDIIATIKAMKSLGANIIEEDNKLTITGINNFNNVMDSVYCNESGSTLRFIIPIFSLADKEITFLGEPSLLKRPQTIYEDIFNEYNIPFLHTPDKIKVNGKLRPGTFRVNGNVSSQFISGLLFTLPLLDEDSKIEIIGTLESKPYIDLTIDILSKFSITIIEEENGYFIQGNQTYKSTNYYCEGDYSQAAFFAVGGQLNTELLCDNIPNMSLQGDKAIFKIIESMNGKLSYFDNSFITSKSNTNGNTIDLSQCPDLGPIVAVLASLSEGTTTIINAERLRIKESDRIESTVNVLSSLGADIKGTKDGMIINGKEMLEGGVTVDSFNDHRIAMSVAIAATKCRKPVILTTAQSINKSYPAFYEDYQSLGGKVTIIEE